MGRARARGGAAADTRLRTLKRHAIQEIETWDDADEGAARRIATALAHGTPVSGMGDDAQLLAGSTLALLDNPGRYDKVTTALNEALDNSFALDPIWGRPKTDHAYVRTTIADRWLPRRGWLVQVAPAAPSRRATSAPRTAAAGGH